MKNFKYVLLGLLVLGAVASCDMFDTGETQTKSECLAGFFSTASAENWTSMYTYIHPDNPNRNNYKSDWPWSTIYDSTVTYTPISTIGDTWTVTVSASAQTEYFTFKENGDGYWMILSFTNGGLTGTTY